MMARQPEREVMTAKKAFKVGDFVRFTNTEGYAAKAGATATVIRDYPLGDDDEYLRVQWVRDELSGRQADGAYGPTDFVKVKKPKAVAKPSQAYKGNGKHEWEAVAKDTMRLRVPGGWLYSDDHRCFATFVPLPEVVKHAV